MVPVIHLLLLSLPGGAAVVDVIGVPWGHASGLFNSKYWQTRRQHQTKQMREREHN